eukprot:1072619-Rhodomonas_salina.3
MLTWCCIDVLQGHTKSVFCLKVRARPTKPAHELDQAFNEPTHPIKQSSNQTTDQPDFFIDTELPSLHFHSRSRETQPFARQPFRHCNRLRTFAPGASKLRGEERGFDQRSFCSAGQATKNVLLSGGDDCTIRVSTGESSRASLGLEGRVSGPDSRFQGPGSRDPGSRVYGAGSKLKLPARAIVCPTCGVEIACLQHRSLGLIGAWWGSGVALADVRSGCRDRVVVGGQDSARRLPHLVGPHQGEMISTRLAFAGCKLSTLAG